MSATTSTMSARTSRNLSAPLLVGGAFALTTLAEVLIHVGVILFTNKDPHAPGGAIDTIESVGLVGGLGLILALAIAVPMAKTPARAKTGAVILGVLCLISLVVFWSGAPAVLGACAAWLAGLTKGGHPQTGAARAFGIIGVVIAILGIVAVFTAPVLGALM